MWSSYVLAHCKEPHGPLGSEDGALRAAGPNEPYEPLDSRTTSGAPFARYKQDLHCEDSRCLHASDILCVLVLVLSSLYFPNNRKAGKIIKPHWLNEFKKTNTSKKLY